jgi:hypothetical protein
MMGGEYEDKIEVQKSISDEVKVQGIRFHLEKGFIHFHDDKAKLKCAIPLHVWKAKWYNVRLPKDSQTFTHEDEDNKSLLTVTSRRKDNTVKINMSLVPFKPPETYDKVWHALEGFTQKLG